MMFVLMVAVAMAGVELNIVLAANLIVPLMVLSVVIQHGFSMVLVALI